LPDLDDQVVRLLTALRETGQLDATWVFLVSDNGYLLGEHRLFGKEQPYEENIGIPFVVAGPGVALGTPDAFVSQVDLMPTTLDIAGLDPYDGRPVDGRSMLTGLTTGSWRGWRRRLFCENPNSGWAMIREGKWAYVDNYGRGGDQELYNLNRDPYQLRSRHDRFETGSWKTRVNAFRQATGAQLRDLEVAL
jgi:arylsulfatase A-like enzyme